jgi:tripartite-type tricarboxylate transporter receptor subunit TctC
LQPPDFFRYFNALCCKAAFSFPFRSLVMQRRHFIQASAAGLLGTSVCASAQSYPSKPINWIVPWAAGGSADFASRLIGAELGKVLGQSVAVWSA